VSLSAQRSHELSNVTRFPRALDSLCSLIQSLPAAIIVFDKDLKYVAASKRFYEESPLRGERVSYGDHWYKIVPDMPEKWKDIHQRCLKGEHLKCDEDPFYRADGNIEWWRWEIRPWYHEDHEIVGLILYVENITAQKSVEHNLRHMVRVLNQSNDDLAKFAHMCAHDLCEPLRTITNYIQIISKELKLTGDSNTRKYFSFVIESTKYMKDLIHGILRNSESKEEKVLKIRRIDVSELVRKLLLALGSMIRSKKAVIEVGSMPVIYGDAVLITEVFQNLISNALKYNDKPIPQIHIQAKEEEGAWCFSVQDNGIGIEEEALEKIFKESIRLNPKSLYQGSGLGLYQCSKIIKAHGGMIWARSSLGKGSTFFFTLPKAQKAQKKLELPEKI
jgi:PAS domain S-box-containing protein